MTTAAPVTPGLSSAPATPSANELRARRVAEEFEGFFISMMLETMSSGIEVDPMFGGGQGEQVYR